MIEAPKFQKLRQQATPEQQDAKLKQVGELYEKQFLREMVKAMRSTVHESGFIKTSQAEQIFREQLDQEYVENWGKKGGIGLADMIHHQLLEKYGAQLGIRAADQKPVGPLRLDEKSNFQGRVVQNKINSNLPGFTLEYQRGESQPGTQDLLNPWSGKLLGHKRLDSGENILHIEHDNGLESTLSFRGTGLGLLAGDKVEEGGRLGLLSPEADRFFWSLQKSNVQKIQGF
jgi:flagellar protein FlgJ